MQRIDRWLMMCGLMIGGFSISRSESNPPLMPLVEISAQRLAIAESVALSKWDSGAPVNDSQREEQVLDAVVKNGDALGLNRAQIKEFFRAQFEASKVIQYSLLAKWQRAGTAPAHDPINLVNEVRPKLDDIDKRLLAELKSTVTNRSTKTCSRDVADAVGNYLKTRGVSVDSREAVALDRAMAAACIP